MFVLPTGLRLPPELPEAFNSLAAVVAPFCADVDDATETFWALHGLTELERWGRIGPTARPADAVAVTVGVKY